MKKTVNVIAQLAVLVKMQKQVQDASVSTQASANANAMDSYHVLKPHPTENFFMKQNYV